MSRTMQLLRRSILFLKDAPGGDSEGQEQRSSGGSHQEQRRRQQETPENDPYRSALCALTTEQVETTVDYLAPMTVVFPESTVLSKAIAAGYPNTPYNRRGHHRSFTEDSNHNTTGTNDCIWAFAVTSQNAVHAIEAALQQQLHPDIREAWLGLPIYCLTGATLTSVKRVGFMNINCRNPFATEPTSGSSLSFDNGAQLVDFLISLEWPSEAATTSSTLTSISTSTSISTPTSTSTSTSMTTTTTMTTSRAATEEVQSPINPVPQLWFLTGETRMKTLHETLTAHQKPFREIVVYKTGPRPQFEEEFAQWLTDKTAEQRQHGVVEDKNDPLSSSSLSSSSSSSSSSSPPTTAAPRKNVLWLVGFSPRGVDIAVPTLKTLLEKEHQRTMATNECEDCEVRWAAIGPTTAKRIEEHLATTFQALRMDPVPAQSSSAKLTLRPAVVVARAPKPDAIVEAILS